jgi:hypothetical protein
MLIVVNGQEEFVIEDKYVEYSPYLYAARDTERLMTGNNWISIDVDDVSVVVNYLSFLRGDDFDMTTDIEDFFSTMGHENIQNYPLPYWRCKLKSKWTRDNFYRLDLSQRDGGMYGLTEVDVENRAPISMTGYETWDSSRSIPPPTSIDTEKHGVVVAGGASLWSAGMINTFGDVDFFSLDRKKSIKFFRGRKDTRRGRSIKGAPAKVYQNYWYGGVKALANSYSRNGYMDWYRHITLIRRVYTCPAEIVHGFDLDVCQFVSIYKNGIPRIYATDIGLYAATTGEQWYDPEMASTTYVQRLAKYAARGIHLRIPLIEMSKVHVPNNLHSDMEMMARSIRYPKYRGGDDEYHKWVANKVPTDLGSILVYIVDLPQHDVLYSKMARDLVPRNDWRSYSDELKGVGNDIWSLSWMEENPMKQEGLSGVIYPLPYLPMEEVYARSPIVNDEWTTSWRRDDSANLFPTEELLEV